MTSALHNGTFWAFFVRWQFGQHMKPSTMDEISISIENKYFGGEHKVITLKQQFLGIILCFLCIEMAMAIASL